MGRTLPVLGPFLNIMTYKVQNLTINGTSIDGVLGIRTRDHRMAGTDKSTELWLTHQNTYTYVGHYKLVRKIIKKIFYSVAIGGECRWQVHVNRPKNFHSRLKFPAKYFSLQFFIFLLLILFLFLYYSIPASPISTSFYAFVFILTTIMTMTVLNLRLPLYLTPSCTYRRMLHCMLQGVLHFSNKMLPKIKP